MHGHMDKLEPKELCWLIRSLLKEGGQKWGQGILLKVLRAIFEDQLIAKTMLIIHELAQILIYFYLFYVYYGSRTEQNFFGKD